MAESNKKVPLSSNPFNSNIYQIYWSTALFSEKQGVQKPAITVGSRSAGVTSGGDLLGKNLAQKDMIQYFNARAITTDIILPLNTSIALAQEYQPSIQNKISAMSTLGGNSITMFGQGIKKIGMKISIIKAGDHWITYAAALESLHYISSNPGRYYGSMYLLGYDSARPSSPRRYKVVTDTLSMSMRSDKNIIDADLTFLVVHDFSMRNSIKGAGGWGRL